MAKNKVNQKNIDEELIDQDEVIYEEEDGGSGSDSAGGQSFLQKYQNVLIGGGVVALAVILFLVISSRGGNEKNLEAQAEMINPVIFYEQDSFPLAINGNGQFVGFDGLYDDYSGTPAGNLMKYYIGTAYLKMGNYVQALEYLEDFDKGNDMISSAAYAAEASANEAQNAFAEAGGLYESAARTPSVNDFSTPYYLMHAARNYESASNNDKALEIYKRIRKDFPNSEQAVDGSIEKYIAKLSADAIDG